LPDLPGGQGEADLTVDEGLLSYLEEHREGAEYLVAVQGSASAVPFILATGEPVMTMGGFAGADPWPTQSELERLVAAGEIHFVLLGGPRMIPQEGPPAGVLPKSPGGTDAPRAGAPPLGLGPAIRWVLENGEKVQSRDYGGNGGAGTLYYLE
jgi:hypothetical protein